MNFSRFRIFALTVLAAALFATAGCGSSKDKSSSFKGDYKGQSATIKKLGDDVGAAFTAAPKTSDAQAVVTFGALAKRARAAAAALLKLEAPDAMKADQAALATALSKAAVDLDAVVAAGRSGDTEGAKQAFIALSADSAPVKDARANLDAASK
jgi:hypothetical protein